MKNNKKTIKNITKLVISMLITLFLVISPAIVFNQDNYVIGIKKLLTSTNQSSIVDLWHIESFEGGSVSRSKFLQNQAVKFNKSNHGCFVIIKSLTIEQVKLNLNNNTFPDMVSFGVGAGELFASLLQPFEKTYSVRQDLLYYGQINRKQLALPYMLGGYAVITNNSKIEKGNQEKDILNNLFDFGYKQKNRTVASVVFARNTVCDIASVLLENNVDGNKTGFLDNNYTTYQAYEAFVRGEAVSLIGTQRDVVRCLNRTQNGKLDECTYSYLGGYTDMMQYLGVLKNIGQQKTDIAFSFAEYLVGGESQNGIKNINMFSVLEKPIYDSQDSFYDFEKALKKDLKSISVFVSNNVLNGNKVNSCRNLGII